MAEITLDESNFEDEVIFSDIPVLVDFWAEWCGPCRMLGPIVSALAEKYEGKLKVCKLNVEDAMSIAEEYNIENIPAIKFFKNGDVVEESLGFVQQPVLEQIIGRII
ncbi:MAG: thioredoxin [Saccharofermentans sp.]|nr:thioredoxin [Saccharofermentans sp.]